jgi:hypothetical protein
MIAPISQEPALNCGWMLKTARMGGRDKHERPEFGGWQQSSAFLTGEACTKSCS